MMRVDGADTGRSLLAVFAHPDDEALASGGLLAWCAARGARVSLLCASRGGLGQLDDPQRLAMGEIRARELDEAARVLGLHEVILLDYRNGFLPWVEREALETDIRAAITRLKPDVVVTFDNDGLYWHPDHIVVHQRTTAVVAAMGEEAPALFYVSMPRGQMRGVLTAAIAAAHPDAPPPQRVLGVDEVDAFGLFAGAPTLVLDAGAFAPTKLAALRCHRTQIAGDGLDLLPADEAPRLLGVEHYRRADVGARGEAFIERLGRRVGS
jgi:N-acetyl-1-D-myo-inositol-2-amino-2-deoxy-alpha-D-glucopyranoside deacetylase